MVCRSVRQHLFWCFGRSRLWVSELMWISLKLSLSVSAAVCMMKLTLRPNLRKHDVFVELKSGCVSERWALWCGRKATCPDSSQTAESSRHERPTKKKPADGRRAASCIHLHSADTGNQHSRSHYRPLLVSVGVSAPTLNNSPHKVTSSFHRRNPSFKMLNAAAQRTAENQQDFEWSLVWTDRSSEHVQSGAVGPQDGVHEDNTHESLNTAEIQMQSCSRWGVIKDQICHISAFKYVKYISIYIQLSPDVCSATQIGTRSVSSGRLRLLLTRQGRVRLLQAVINRLHIQFKTHF